MQHENAVRGEEDARDNHVCRTEVAADEFLHDGGGDAHRRVSQRERRQDERGAKKRATLKACGADCARSLHGVCANTCKQERKPRRVLACDRLVVNRARRSHKAREQEQGNVHLDGCVQALRVEKSLPELFCVVISQVHGTSRVDAPSELPIRRSREHDDAHLHERADDEDSRLCIRWLIAENEQGCAQRHRELETDAEQELECVLVAHGVKHEAHVRDGGGDEKCGKLVGDGSWVSCSHVFVCQQVNGVHEAHDGSSGAQHEERLRCERQVAPEVGFQQSCFRVRSDVANERHASWALAALPSRERVVQVCGGLPDCLRRRGEAD